jgi:hypothetical protein
VPDTDPAGIAVPTDLIDLTDTDTDAATPATRGRAGRPDDGSAA